MGFSHLSILALFCLVLVEVQASQPTEDYWQSIWPNTSLPKTLWDLLQSSGETELPIGAENMQYWTVFLEHDLHPGKKMSLGYHKHSHVQPFGVRIWLSKESESESNPQAQPFGVRIWLSKESESESNPQPQPFGARIWSRKAGEIERNPQVQPFGIRIWPGKSSETEKTKEAIETEIDRLEDFCETSAGIGEDKYCATSLESMMDFAISKLGKNIRVMSSSFAQNQEQYTVEEVRKVGERAVMCHRLNFRKVAFYCHEVNATTSYIVPLVAPDGTKSKALAICHHDTRGMDPNMLYEILKVKPGTVPVCHFVGNKAVAWVPNSPLNEVDSPCVV